MLFGGVDVVGDIEREPLDRDLDLLLDPNLDLEGKKDIDEDIDEDDIGQRR